ncbi:DUF3093 domain-containing protein [Mycetocola tolaasinivorans]|uniref:DUF3093 domain-containing protein n=1 Tax=Mycetocola tolaasinivorans TaxID=76635 RepID=A0A3L7A9E0_9MICO|nr:DUF3093 domain-containing protein [Mycetocola tolaasinivorans]RLP76963.1 DUF3093 domain-containing protein [Mycetocola tolaasinivorans]
MTQYHERLFPAPTVFLATALVIPASILVFFPISIVVGFVVAAVLYLGSTALFLIMAPTVSIEDGVLRAGRARIPVDQLGTPEVFVGEAARAERGPNLNARAYLLLNAWAHQAVRVPVLDEGDPTPYWLISTRRAAELAAAITSAAEERAANV